MKKYGLLLAVLFCFLSTAQAKDTLTTNVEIVPKVYQVCPTTTVTLAPARWMEFSDCICSKGELPCCNTLKSISGKYRGGKSTGYIGSEPDFEEVPGLTLSNIDTENASSVLITWTVRIEGSGKRINPWGSFCSKWHGTITENFRGGKAYSLAYVDYGKGYVKAIEGQPAATMTVPDAGVVTFSNPSDPTHTGSCLLKAPAEGFPAKIDVKIYWKNDTSLTITSKAKYRTLIVTVFPKGKNE